MNKFSSTLVFNQRGFTLLEILIAITLLAFITLGVVSITEDATNTKDRTIEINKNNLQVETAMSRFEWDFSQIYSPLYFSQVMNMQTLMQAGAQAGAQGGVPGGPQGGQAGGADGGGDDGAAGGAGAAGTQGGGMNPQMQAHLQEYFQRLVQRFERNEHFMAVSQEGLPVPRFFSPDRQTFEFFTSSNRRKRENVRQSHFAWVRYALAEPRPRNDQETNPNIPQGLRSLVRYFSPDDPYGDRRIDPQQVKASVLLENVERLDFQFWDLGRRKWETSLRAIPQGENVIRGVKMSVTWYDSMGIKRSTTRIFRNHWPLVVPANNQQPGRPNPQGGAQGGAPRGELD
jgi:prepilin-type N-terminal cleavage/methylation domain-containing protein